jgi:hypothetical protein
LILQLLKINLNYGLPFNINTKCKYIAMTAIILTKREPVTMPITTATKTATIRGHSNNT